jgi:hypothetical protein
LPSLFSFSLTSPLRSYYIIKYYIVKIALCQCSSPKNGRACELLLTTFRQALALLRTGGEMTARGSNLGRAKASVIQTGILLCREKAPGNSLLSKFLKMTAKLQQKYYTAIDGVNKIGLSDRADTRDYAV